MLFADTDLTTLEAVKAQLKLTTTDTVDDELIQKLLHAASDMVTQFCDRAFVPCRETRRYDARGEHVSAYVLDVGSDLLEIKTLTNGDGVVITSAQYVLRPANLTPKYRIELRGSAGISWTYSADWQEALVLDGVWGYHEDYARAWVDTLENVPGGGLTDSATSFTASDADGKDARYATRFQVGRLLKIEDEFLQVAAVNTTTNLVTVSRGANGSTAASHAAGKDILSFAPMRNVEQACVSLVAWLYRNKDTAGDDIQFMDGTRVITNRAPSNIRDTLMHYRRLPV